MVVDHEMKTVILITIIVIISILFMIIFYGYRIWRDSKYFCMETFGGTVAQTKINKIVSCELYGTFNIEHNGEKYHIEKLGVITHEYPIVYKNTIEDFHKLEHEIEFKRHQPNYKAIVSSDKPHYQYHILFMLKNLGVLNSLEKRISNELKFVLLLNGLFEYWYHAETWNNHHNDDNYKWFSDGLVEGGGYMSKEALLKVFLHKEVT